jgi:hypothetical protein
MYEEREERQEEGRLAELIREVAIPVSGSRRLSKASKEM